MAAEPSIAGSKRTSADAQDAPEPKRANMNGIDAGDMAEDEDEATTKEELQATKAPSPAAGAEAPSKPRNAFSELMAPKPKAPPKVAGPSSSSSRPRFTGRDGLGVYLASPDARPQELIFQTPSCVAIRDAFPKATVHCLLLPRSPAHNRLHPFDAFEDAEFLAAVRADAARLGELVAKELQRRLGRHSRAEAARNAVLDGDVEPAADGALPAGRDWMREIMVGIHAKPSMNHLHVHVLSRDMHGDRLKHRKHYNSFTTRFFVPLGDFPLAEDDERRHQGNWPERPMVCWRCGRDFGNRFKELKDHLEGEFEEWKKA